MRLPLTKVDKAFLATLVIGPFQEVPDGAQIVIASGLLPLIWVDIFGLVAAVQKASNLRL